MEIPKPVPGNQLQRPQIWPPPLQCPRCDSANMKFCYFNNYSRLQPRYLCKACRRHWTEGGTLRNVPVGGGRKDKRNKATTAKAATAAAASAAATTAASAAAATAAAAAATTAASAAAAAATTAAAAAAATDAAAATTAAAAAAATDAAAAATVINSSSINDPTEILHRVLLRPPPPPVVLADYGITSTVMSSLQSDHIGNIAAEPNTTVSSYGSTPAQVLFFGYSDEGLGTMISASNAWHVAPHAQPPPASSGGSEAVPAALEASATRVLDEWMAGRRGVRLNCNRTQPASYW